MNSWYFRFVYTSYLLRNFPKILVVNTASCYNRHGTYKKEIIIKNVKRYTYNEDVFSKHCITRLYIIQEGRGDYPIWFVNLFQNFIKRTQINHVCIDYYLTDRP